MIIFIIITKRKLYNDHDHNHDYHDSIDNNRKSSDHNLSTVMDSCEYKNEYNRLIATHSDSDDNLDNPGVAMQPRLPGCSNIDPKRISGGHWP